MTHVKLIRDWYKISSFFPSRAIRGCLEHISGWVFMGPSSVTWTNGNSFTRSQGSHICLRYHTGWRYDRGKCVFVCVCTDMHVVNQCVKGEDGAGKTHNHPSVLESLENFIYIPKWRNNATKSYTISASLFRYVNESVMTFELFHAISSVLTAVYLWKNSLDWQWNLCDICIKILTILWRILYTNYIMSPTPRTSTVSVLEKTH